MLRHIGPVSRFVFQPLPRKITAVQRIKLPQFYFLVWIEVYSKTTCYDFRVFNEIKSIEDNNFRFKEEVCLLGVQC
jgi:hypothetical protein